MTFQDGTPFDSAAVKFNLDREFDPKNDCWCRAFISAIKSVETAGAEHVILHRDKPYAPLPYSLAGIFGGLVASPTALQKYGKDYANHPVGAGPFRFVSQQSGNSITFERWDGYREKGRPYLQKVTFRAIGDAQAHYGSVLSGSIQSDENAAFRQVVAARDNPAVKVQSIPGLGTIFVMFDVRKPPFDNVEARRAVGFATNFRVLRGEMLRNLAEDYVLAARAKGISRLRAVLRHVLRNSLVALVTVIGIGFGPLVSGAVIVERPVLAARRRRPARHLDLPARRRHGARRRGGGRGDRRAGQPRRRCCARAARPEGPLRCRLATPRLIAPWRHYPQGRFGCRAAARRGSGPRCSG